MRIILTTLLLSLAALHVGAVSVAHLRTCGDTCPIGIDKTELQFSWIISSDQRSTVQTSYSIAVATDAQFEHRVWESGKISSDQSVDVIATGFQPQPMTRYYWQVTVTDNHDETATSSEKAYFETGLMSAQTWNESQWIRATNAGASISVGEVPILRREFSLGKQIAWARLYSTALGIYNVYINGERVGIIDDDGNHIQDELKPGWTDYTKRVFYLTHDVTSLLQKGKNAIGAELSSGWWNGAIARGRNGSSPQLGFRCMLFVRYTDGSEEHICTDTDNWKSSTNGPLRLGDIYAGETYDARLESDWNKADFDDSSWSAVALNTDFKGEITAYEGPIVRVVDNLERPMQSATIYSGTTSTGTTYGALTLQKKYTKAQTMTLSSGQTLVYDFGQNASGWVNFKVRGTKGTKLTFRFAEILNTTGDEGRGEDGPAGSVYVANLRTAKATLTYTLRGDQSGEEFHPTSTFFGFRYVQVTSTKDVTINSMKAETLTSAMYEDSHFQTNSSDVNQLISNIKWGQYSNFISVPMDCPQRDERLGWTCDTQVFSNTAMYNADLRNFYRKWLQDLRDSQPDNGAYTRIAPFTSGGNAGAAGWADAGIILPWNMYLMTGDKQILRDMWDSNERYMDWLATQTGDGYNYNGGSTAYADWVAFVETDKRYVAVCYYANSAALMAKMANVLSEQSGDDFAVKASKYTTLFGNIRSEFSKRYLKSIVSTPTIDTQTAYLLPLHFGMFRTSTINKRNAAALKTNIEANGNKLTTGFLGTSVLCQTLSDNGLSDVAYTLLLQHECPSWLYSVDQGATTIWERWNSYSKDTGMNPDKMNSLNHYAYGCVQEWMYRYMAGISYDEADPGFHHIILQPTIDDRTTDGEKITDVSAQTWSQYGTIQSAWKNGGNGSLTFDFTIPANTTATLTIPVASGLQVYESGTLASKCQGIELVSEANGSNTYNLGSGTYHFQVADPSTVEDAIQPVHADGNPGQSQAYDLSGCPVSPASRGIIIQNGVKKSQR